MTSAKRNETKQKKRRLEVEKKRSLLLERRIEQQLLAELGMRKSQECSR